MDWQRHLEARRPGGWEQLRLRLFTARPAPRAKQKDVCLCPASAEGSSSLPRSRRVAVARGALDVEGLASFASFSAASLANLSVACACHCRVLHLGACRVTHSAWPRGPLPPCRGTWIRRLRGQPRARSAAAFIGVAREPAKRA